MEITTVTTNTPGSSRQIAINALAAVGFIVLIVLGMGLAIYAATFVPTAANRVGSAAVYLSQIFVPREDASLDVVEPGTSVPFPEAPGAGVASSTATTTPAAPVAQTPAAGRETYTVYPAGTTPRTPTLTGLPDLTVDIIAVGYLTSADTSSFVKSTTVPSGERGAVKFVIKNIGTNTSGRFTFEAPLPTSRTYTFTSDSQAALLPGEQIEYVLGFDRAKSGDSRTIEITVDPDSDIKESNESNNSDSATITIK